MNKYGDIILVNPTDPAWRRMLEECDVEPLSMQTLYRGEILRRLLESGAANLDYVHDELLRRHGHISEKDFCAALVTLILAKALMKVVSVSEFSFADLPRIRMGN